MIEDMINYSGNSYHLGIKAFDFTLIAFDLLALILFILLIEVSGDYIKRNFMDKKTPKE